MRSKRIAISILIGISIMAQSQNAEARIGHPHAHRTSVCRPPSPAEGQESIDFVRGCLLRNSGVALTIFGVIAGSVGTAMLLGSKSAPRPFAIGALGLAAPTLFSGIALWGAGQLRMNDARNALSAPVTNAVGVSMRLNF